jgi:drug/metabolite transporter (DMT)-like permease
MIGLMIFASIIAILPIFLIKEYIKTNKIFLLISAMICYFILMQTYINIFKHKEVGSTFVLLQGLQILLIVISSSLLFGEVITFHKTIGFISGGICIGLLS